MSLPEYRKKREKIQKAYDRATKKWERESPKIPAFDNKNIGLRNIDIKVSIELRPLGLRLINYVNGNLKRRLYLRTNQAQ